MCVPVPGETHHSCGREGAETGRDTPVMLPRRKDFPRDLVATTLPKEVRSEELCPVAEYLLHLRS